MIKTKPTFAKLVKPSDYIPTATCYIMPEGIYAPDNGNPTHNPVEGAKLYNEYIQKLANNQLNIETLDEIINIALKEETEQAFLIASYLVKLAKSKDNDSKYLSVFFEINNDKSLPKSIKKNLATPKNRQLSAKIVLKLQNKLNEKFNLR